MRRSHSNRRPRSAPAHSQTDTTNQQTNSLMQARYSFTSLHRVQGIRLAASGPAVPVIEREDLTALFVSDVSELSETYIHSRAAARFLAHRLFAPGAQEERQFSSLVEQEIEFIRTSLDGAAVLAVESRGLVEIRNDTDRKVEWNGWLAGIELFDK